VFFAIISIFYVVLAKKRGGFPQADLEAFTEPQKEDA
jgi:APC family amino acid-polyamine-organocation transporter